MPFLLIFLAIIMLVSGFRGTTSELLTLLEGDFVSSQGFLPWALAVLGIGAVGYIPRVKPLSDAFLVLVIIVLLLKNGSFFSKLTTAYDSAGATNAELNTSGTQAAGLNPTGSTMSGSQTATSLLQSVLGNSPAADVFSTGTPSGGIGGFGSTGGDDNSAGNFNFTTTYVPGQ